MTRMMESGITDGCACRKMYFDKVIGISDDACAFIHHNKTIVCSTGKMFDVSSGSIREIEEPFAFVVGEKPK